MTIYYWMRSILLHGKGIKLSKAKVHVYSESVQCLGNMHKHSESTEKVKRTSSPIFPETWCLQKIFGIDREPFEFEWNIFPGHAAVEILKEIQIKMATRRKRFEEFEDRIIMSMFNDIDWTKNGNHKGLSNSWTVKSSAKSSQLGYWLFSRSWLWRCGTHNGKLEGQWNATADVMVYNFGDSGHPVFQSHKCVSARILEKEKLDMYDWVQWWHVECVALISHDKFCKSAQYKRSSRGLVWWFDSTDSWWVIFKCGEIHCESERRSYIEICLLN